VSAVIRHWAQLRGPGAACEQGRAGGVAAWAAAEAPSMRPPTRRCPRPGRGSWTTGWCTTGTPRPTSRSTTGPQPRPASARGADTGPRGRRGAGQWQQWARRRGTGVVGRGPLVGPAAGGQWQRRRGGVPACVPHGAPGTAASASDVAAYKAQHEITVIVSPCPLHPPSLQLHAQAFPVRATLLRQGYCAAPCRSSALELSMQL